MLKEWTQQGLNLRPSDYESDATDQLSYGSIKRVEEERTYYKELRCKIRLCKLVKLLLMNTLQPLLSFLPYLSEGNCLLCGVVCAEEAVVVVSQCMLCIKFPL